MMAVPKSFLKSNIENYLQKTQGKKKLKTYILGQKILNVVEIQGFGNIYFFDTSIDFDTENKFYTVNGNIYETIEDSEPDDLCFLKDNGDGTFDYTVEFYNGGTCLEECIEHELKKLK